MKLDILAIGVHPDDSELSCSGTLIKHVDLGYKVGILDLTQGELGSRGSAELRLQEANAAKELMGILVRENINIGDGFFHKEKENLLKIIEYIRLWKPEIVLANAISDRHPDHGRGAELVARACFLSGLIKINTHSPIDGNVQEKWRPKNVYHYIQDNYSTPDFVVDISAYMEQKVQSILSYKSQFFLPSAEEYKDQPQTPISGKGFMDYIYAKDKVFGRSIQVDYAEGFHFSNKVPGVKDLFDLV